MKHLLCWLALLPIAEGPALAGCYSCAPAYPVYRERVVIRKKIVPIAVQVPVVVPAYGAVFIPPPPVIVQQGTTTVGQQSVSYSQQQTAYAPAAVASVQGYAATQAAAQSYQAPMPQAAPAQCPGPAAAPGGYAPGLPQRQAAPGNACADLEAVMQKLESIHKRLCAIEGTEDEPTDEPEARAPRPAKGQPAARGVRQAPRQPQTFRGMPRSAGGCAACHTQGKLQGDGNTFAMFQGTRIAPLTERQWGLVMIKTQRREMPPQNNLGIPALTAVDSDEWLDFVAKQKQFAQK